MKKTTILFVALLLRSSFALAQAGDFKEDYSKQPACEGTIPYTYYVANKHLAHGRVYTWTVTGGTCTPVDNGGVRVNWNVRSNDGSSMPKGKISFSYLDSLSGSGSMEIPVYSIDGLKTNVTINGQSNPTKVSIPYGQSTFTASVTGPAKYPNTNDNITFEWKLSQGLTYLNSTNFHTYASNQVTISVGACDAGSYNINVSALDKCDPEHTDEVRYVEVERVASTPTLSLSTNTVSWGTPTQIICTAQTSVPADRYEWVVDGNFIESGTHVTTTPNITLTHKGCSAGTVSVSAVYCGDKKSVAAQATVNVTQPSVSISGPTSLCQADIGVYTIENLPPNATVTWQLGSCYRAVDPSAVGVQGTNSSLAIVPSCNRGTSWVEATISVGDGACTYTIRKNVSMPRWFNSELVSSKYNERNISHGCSFTDEIMYEGQIIGHGNSLGISAVEWSNSEPLQLYRAQSPALYNSTNSGVILNESPYYDYILHLRTKYPTGNGFVRQLLDDSGVLGR